MAAYYTTAHRFTLLMLSHYFRLASDSEQAIQNHFLAENGDRFRLGR